MSDLIQAAVLALDNVINAANQAKTALTGIAAAPGVMYDTYMTDVLDEDGLWRPVWLDLLNAEYATPDGFIGNPEPDHDGDPSTQSRRKVTLIKGFYFDLALKRGDLTRDQQASIHKHTQDAFLRNTVNSQRDEVTGLLRLQPQFTEATNTAKPGAELAFAVGAQAYNTGEELYRATRRLYDIHLRT